MDDLITARLEPSRVPIGVNPDQYYRRFLENSPRLFKRPEDVEQLEVVRMLMKSRGRKQGGIKAEWQSIIESSQVESIHGLEDNIKVSFA